MSSVKVEPDSISTSEQLRSAKRLIGSTVTSFFRDHEFHRKKRWYWRVSKGVVLSAQLDVSSWSPYFRLAYFAAICPDQGDLSIGQGMRVDVYGDFGWLSGRRPGPLHLMDAAIVIDPDERALKLRALLELDALAWYANVSTVPLLLETIRKENQASGPYFANASGLRAAGLLSKEQSE